ncbi:hypothetical protein C6T63_25865 [Burkholderia multivorans]|nr:hypothetical protein C6T63_25865 [Burkholderia multivorans]
MTGDRNRLQVDDARRIGGGRGSDGVHGSDGDKVGDAARQKLCRARREVRSFDNRCAWRPAGAAAVAKRRVATRHGTPASMRPMPRIAIISHRMTCDAV